MEGGSSKSGLSAIKENSDFSSVDLSAEDAESKLSHSVFDCLNRVSPYIIFDDSPLHYLSDAKHDSAHKFATAMGMDQSIQWYDPHTITYQVITPGGKLIGALSCSDSFGVDLMMDRLFEKAEIWKLLDAKSSE